MSAIEDFFRYAFCENGKGALGNLVDFNILLLYLIIIPPNYRGKGAHGEE